MNLYSVIFIVEGTLERKEDRKKIAAPIIGGRLSRQDGKYQLKGALACSIVEADSPEEAFEKAQSRLTAGEFEPLKITGSKPETVWLGDKEWYFDENDHILRPEHKVSL